MQPNRMKNDRQFRVVDIMLLNPARYLLTTPIKVKADVSVY